MSHDELVEAARRWCAKRYPVVITEMATWAQEIPDVLAFTAEYSLLIECKASREDFFADSKKPWRDKKGVGKYRAYFTEKGLLLPGEVPYPWGLYELVNGKVFNTVPPEKIADHNYQGEQMILVSALRRIGIRSTDGVSIRCYTAQTQNRATLTVAEGRE
jgi:hypothetical protein